MKIEEFVRFKTGIDLGFDSHEIFVCEECGSPDVETTYWCNCTTGIASTINENDAIYCDNCGKTTIITLEEYNKKETK